MDQEQTEAVEPQPAPLSRKLLAITLFYLAAFAILVVGQLAFPLRVLEGFFFMIGIPLAAIGGAAVYALLLMFRSWLPIPRDKITDLSLLTFVSFSVASTLIFVTQFDDISSSAVEAISADARGKCVVQPAAESLDGGEPCAQLAVTLKTALNGYVESLYQSEEKESDASLAKQRRLLEVIQDVASLSTIEPAKAQELTRKLLE